VSCDLAVWVSEPPTSDADAAESYAALATRLEEPPVEDSHPSLIAFVDDLLARYPDITDERREDSPWSTGPLRSEIVGPFFTSPCATAVWTPPSRSSSSALLHAG
jgi:hypothetical protein